MSYEQYKEHRLAPDDNGCWDVLTGEYEQVATYPSKAAAKRAINELDSQMTQPNQSELDEQIPVYEVEVIASLDGGSSYYPIKVLTLDDCYSENNYLEIDPVGYIKLNKVSENE